MNASPPPLRLANCTRHNQTPYLEQFRYWGFEVHPEPLLEVVTDPQQARLVAMNAVRRALEQEPRPDGILLGGRTDLCCYAALFAVPLDLSVWTVDVDALRMGMGFPLVNLWLSPAGPYQLSGARVLNPDLLFDPIWPGRPMVTEPMLCQVCEEQTAVIVARVGGELSEPLLVCLDCWCTRPADWNLREPGTVWPQPTE